MSLGSTQQRDGASHPPPTSAERLGFDRDNSFQRELRRRVEADFRQRGCAQRDSAQMYAKTAIIIGTFAAAYTALVWFASAWWQVLPLTLLLGTTMAGIGFNVMHDGGHQAYSKHRWVNRLMAFTLDLVGGSSYIWQWKHARYHHTYVNIAHHDSDIDLGVLGRLSPDQPRRAWHRWQHMYLWVLYSVTAIRWHLYGDFRDMFTGRIGDRPFERPRGVNLALFVLGKLIFFTLAFVLPLTRRGFGTVLLFYAAVSAVAGFLLAIVFQLAHVVEEADFPSPAVGGDRMDTPWAIHQLQTTVDFARDNRVLSWLIGGLNFQVEHHLFVRISHVHYRAVSRVVEATCCEFGVPYHVHPTFAAGIASHYRWLRRLGAAPATRASTLSVAPTHP